jgi:hypothetical protein
LQRLPDTLAGKMCVAYCLTEPEVGLRSLEYPHHRVRNRLSRSGLRHGVIWLGWTSNCSPMSASVFSPVIAVSATFALKAGLWFRQTRPVKSASVHDKRVALRSRMHLRWLSRFPEPTLTTARLLAQQ